MTILKIPCGMESQDADDLREQLGASSQYFFSRKFPDAVYKLETPSKVEKKISTYLEKAKDHAATILNTTSDRLSLENLFLAVYTKLEKPGPSKPAPPNIAIVILALGKLNQNNKLQLFQALSDKSLESFQLESGDMLAARSNTPQWFEGKGGGLAHISIWVRMDATPPVTIEE
ncbi:hypothetical protein AOQ84DRAFT_389989 [Glonium stellatum]|uniref:Uncharacterized protein n=1 Tax=Glonium stellatum TaxID=574774 RepID=A0A8E2JRF6_9PEZI|nr:hypothetical protein AOQ84DRAFT_389989 [Glonium stellatum]